MSNVTDVVVKNPLPRPILFTLGTLRNGIADTIAMFATDGGVMSRSSTDRFFYHFGHPLSNDDLQTIVKTNHRIAGDERRYSDGITYVFEFLADELEQISPATCHDALVSRCRAVGATENTGGGDVLVNVGRLRSFLLENAVLLKIFRLRWSDGTNSELHTTEQTTAVLSAFHETHCTTFIVLNGHPTHRSRRPIEWVKCTHSAMCKQLASETCDAVMKCDDSMHETLFANIVIVGGSNTRRRIVAQMTKYISRNAPQGLKINIAHLDATFLDTTTTGGAVLAAIYA
jgi:hypothetical protein